MNRQSTKIVYLSLCLGLVIALLARVLTSIPALAAGAQKITAASSPAVTTPNLTFTPPDVTFAYGVNAANGSLTVSNLGDGAATDVYLYVDFGVINVTASSAPYTSGSNPSFKLPDIPAAGSYTLTFSLGYSNWCTSSAIERTLVWQPHYHDGRGNDFTSGVAFSLVQSSGMPHLQVGLSGAPDVVQGDNPVSYHVTSAYNGASNCGNGPMGQVAVVDTVPAGFIVEDTGGGTWIPGSGGTGGTLTWTHTRPASLDTTFTLKASESVACGAAFTNAVTATCTDCAGAVPPVTASQISAHACGNLALAQKTVTPVVCERCGENQYTNTYDFSASVSTTLDGLIFRDLAENQQQYIPSSLSAILDGSDITGCVIATDATPGGTLGLDFSGCGVTALGGKNLTIAYRLTVTPATIPACDSLSFFSNSELTLSGQTLYSVVPVQVQAPEMSLAISGLDAVVDKGESNTVTISITSLSNAANPRDARFVLSGANYALLNPAAVVCSGSVSPISCTPAIVGSDYVWAFGDGFIGSGQNAVLELTVQKRVTGGGNLDGRIYDDDRCNDDATSNDTCSTAASAAPAVLRSGDLLIEVSPSVYPTAGKDIQWKTYVTNRGSGTAYNVWVDHVLGNGLAYVSSTVDNPTGVTTTAAQDHSGGVLNGATTAIASLAPGERREITINATRLAQSNLTYTASAAWGVLGVDGQTPVSSSSIVSVLPLIVTNANDSGPGSLRQMIADALAGDTITFADDYTIPITGLTPAKSLTIDGSGHTVTLRGGLLINVGETIVLNGLALSGNGSGGGSGLGIINRGTLTLNRCTVSNYWAPLDPANLVYPGAIYNTGTLTIRQSTLSDNYAGEYGGAIYNGGTVSIQQSALVRNQAQYSGGAIYNASAGTLTIARSTLGQNHATAFGGGAIYNGGQLSLINSTIAENTAPFGGGGLYSDGNVALVNTVMADNSPNQYADLGSVSTYSTSLIQMPLCGSSCEPLLAPLGDYGGPTQTYAILTGSPAINAGNPAYCTGSDQRGVIYVGTCDIGAFESQGFTLAKTGGDDQSALVNTAFANPLAVSIAANNPVEPVAGGVISFTAPTTGASIAVPTAFARSINAGGVVSATVTANGTIGGPYNVTASAAGANSVNFSLTNENIPAAPSGLSASPVSQTQTNLSWTDNSSNETGFKIYRDSTLITTTAANVTAYSDTSLACGTSYTYEVRATNASGDSTGISASAITAVCTPNAPAVITPADGSITSDSTPAINGTAEANSIISIYLDGTLVVTTTTNTGGGWSYTVGSALTDGLHAVKATARNVGGTSPDSNTNTFTVDTLAPLVASITRLDATPTGLAGVRFLVRFSEAVSGVDSASPFGDFSLAASGLSGPAVTGVSGSGAAYTVTVSTGSGNGTLRLDVSDDDTILDAAGNPLGSSFTTGESYTVLRRLLPGITPSANPVNEGTPVIFTGSFSYPMLAPQAGEAVSWNFGDGSSVVGVLAPTHTYGQSGLFTVTLTVTDTNGIVGISSLPLTVNNVTPTVDAGSGGTRLTGIPFAFHGSYTDPGWMETHTIAWSFGDGSLSFGSLTPSHSYTAPGTYTVTLTLTDSKGGVGVDTAVVNVVAQMVVIDPGDDPGDEWSDPITTTTPCGNSFIGEFGSQSVTLTLQSLPAHSQVTVSFDLFIIRSWDGNRVDNQEPLANPYSPDIIVGPDIWQFQAAGNTLLRTTFSNWNNAVSYQAYPGSYPGGSYPAQTGASAINSLCYTYGPYNMSAVYPMRYTFAHTGDTLVLDFSAIGLQVISDESWGLDNVKVSVSNGEGTPYLVYLPIIVR
jgi:uncharacterized repeat protein (TIGR01451 family)